MQHYLSDLEPHQALMRRTVTCTPLWKAFKLLRHLQNKTRFKKQAQEAQYGHFSIQSGFP